jgi:hypothetical protein
MCIFLLFSFLKLIAKYGIAETMTYFSVVVCQSLSFVMPSSKLLIHLGVPGLGTSLWNGTTACRNQIALKNWGHRAGVKG